MDVFKLATLLRPLIPDTVNNLLDHRKLADAPRRQRIDHEIEQLAQKHLGDYRDRLLLSLPPRNNIRGELDLGVVAWRE